MINTVNANKRFEVLDSWRGICAMIVLLGHFQTYLHNSINLGTIIGDNYYLYVDFFFALSGFVIARNYLHRISDVQSLKKFVMVRWGRVYPLHLFVLVMFFLLEIVRAHVEGNAMFINQGKSIESLIANLFLLHSMGTISYLSWNIPSWSISVEFYTYITFALILLIVKEKHIFKAAAIIALVAPLALFLLDGAFEADQTYDYGYIRCLGGFFSGVLICSVYERKNAIVESAVSKAPTFLELTCIFLIMVLALNANDTYVSYLSPYLFAFCLLIFACEKGMLSNLLKNKVFTFLGAISYSLYMTHAFVQRVMVSGLDIVGRKIGFEVVTLGASKEDPTDIVKYFDVSLPIAWILISVMLVAVIIFSTLTYYFVEKPSYKWIKNRAGQ